MLAFYDVMDSVYPTGNYTGGNQTIDEKISFYRNIESKLSDEKFVDALASKLSKIRDKIFNINSLRSVALCSSKENEKLSQDKLADILKSLSKENYEQCKEVKLVSKDTKNMAFIDPSTSNNNIICMVNSKELCESPDFDVACRIITDKFLAPKIREKSGAYGARIYRMVGADKIVMNSYADPNVKSTIETFKSIPDFISNLEIKDIEIEDISKSILGQVFPVNKLGMFSLQSKNKMTSNIDYYKKLNSDISLIKTVTKERIKKQGELLRDAMKNMKILVVSSDRKNLDEKMFDEIIE